MTSNSILFVFKVTSADQLMDKCAKKGILEKILRRSIPDLATISELHRFVSLNVQTYRVKTSFRLKTRVPVPSVTAVWSILANIADWRVVTDLL